MSDLFTWASIQPIWLQVAIGLFVFFILLPVGVFVVLHIAGEMIEWAFEMAPSVGSAIRTTTIVLLVPATLYATWSLVTEVAWDLSFLIGREAKLPPLEYDTLSHWLSIAIYALLLAFYGLIAYRSRTWLKGKLQSWGYMRAKREKET